MGLFDFKISDLIDFGSNTNEEKESKNNQNDMDSQNGTSNNSLFDNMDIPEKLKQFIILSIQDGVITENERNLISKKGIELGMDKDILDFYIEKIEEKLEADNHEVKEQNHPVKQIAYAFKIAEGYSTGGDQVANSEDLTKVLALIPGVGGVAAIGSLASSIIKTPSNLNALKAEIINHAIVPEEETYLADFIEFCELELESENRKSSSKGLLDAIGSIFGGSELNLIPIWEEKIKQLINRAKYLFPNSALLSPIISRYSIISILRKAKQKGKYEYHHEVKKLIAPEDNMELLQIIELLYLDSKDDETINNVYKKMYEIAKKRFSESPELMKELAKYRKKMFGLF